MNTLRRRQAIASAQQVADWDSHAHTGDPDRDLKQNMVRFGYVLRKFGITSKGLGITAHGLRHEALIEEYIAITGQEPPLRGAGEGLTREQEDAARLAVAARRVATLQLDATQRPVSGPTTGLQLALGSCAYSGVTVRHRCSTW